MPLIDIDTKALKREAEKLNTAISSFEGYTKNYLGSAKDSLKGMNSDFITQLERTLDNMGDDSNPKAIKKIKEFANKINAIAAAFEEQDKNLGDSYGNN